MAHSPFRYARLLDEEVTEHANPARGWSASIKTAALVPDGRWSKHQVLRFTAAPSEIDGSAWPADVRQQLNDPSGRKLQPLLAISGHATYNGIWRIVSIEERAAIGGHVVIGGEPFDETVIECAVPQYEGDYAPEAWEPRVRDFATKNILVSPVGAQPSADATMALAPPLRFHVRATLNALDNINVVAQNFQADTFIELRLRSITSDPDETIVADVLRSYAFIGELIELSNGPLAELRTFCNLRCNLRSAPHSGSHARCRLALKVAGSLLCGVQWASSTRRRESSGPRSTSRRRNWASCTTTS